MKFHFRKLAILASFIFFALALTWMFAPDLMATPWGVELSSSAELIGRRGAALYTGMGVMFFSARNAEPSLARSALLKGGVIVCLLLVALGVFELATANAGIGILGAVIIEIVLALAFLAVLLKDRWAECSQSKM